MENSNELSPFNGGRQDPRLEVEKARDYQHDDIGRIFAGGPIVQWVVKDKVLWPFYDKRNQVYSFSCMMQSGCKMLGIENKLVDGTFLTLSARNGYWSRSNRPEGGMFLQEALSFLCQAKQCLESQLPSQGMSENEMNQPFVWTSEMEASATQAMANGYFFINTNRFDTIPTLLSQGKGVQIMLYFLNSEYAQPIPKITNPNLKIGDPSVCAHGVCVTDYFILNGERGFLIEDSAGNESSMDQKGWRFITESFFNARCFGSGYVIKMKYDPTLKPKHHFSKVLTFGTTNDPEVAALQIMLQYEKFLPTEVDGKPLPLGNFKQMTANALRKWQMAHGIQDFAKNYSVTDIRFGNKSIAKANELYDDK